MSRRGRRRAATSLLALGVTLGVAVASVPSPSLAQTGGQAGSQSGAGAAVATVTLAAIDPVVASGTEAAFSVVIEHDGATP
jgi:hypothetical protein